MEERSDVACLVINPGITQEIGGNDSDKVIVFLNGGHFWAIIEIDVRMSLGDGEFVDRGIGEFEELISLVEGRCDLENFQVHRRRSTVDLVHEVAVVCVGSLEKDVFSTCPDHQSERHPGGRDPENHAPGEDGEV